MLGIPFLSNAQVPQANMKFGEQFDMSKLSEQDRAHIEFLDSQFPTDEAKMEFLESVMKEIEQLPKEQQEEFWGAVQMESERLEKELSQAFIPQPAAPAEPMRPIEHPMPKPAAPAPAKPTTDAAKLEEIVLIINTLINKLETILKKFQIIPDIDLKFSEWIRSRQITSVPAGIPLNELKKQMDILISKLNDLKARDPQTKDYRYLHNLLKNELLLNNLRQVSKTLSTHEPAIQVADFTAQAKLNEKTKNALLAVGNCLGDIFYRLGIPASIDALLAGYETRSKELRESKEASIKSAQQPQKTHRIVSPVVAGQAPQGLVYKEPQYRDKQFGGRSSTPSFFETPVAAQKTPEGSKPGTSSAGGAASSAPEKGAIGDKKAEGKKDEKKSTEVKDDKKDEKKEGDDEKKRIEKSFERAESLLLDAVDEVRDLGRVKKNLEDDKAPRSARLANALPAGLNKTKRALDQIKVTKSYAKKLKDDSKKSLVSILESAAKPLKSLSDTIGTIRKDDDRITAEKKYLFLDGKAPEGNPQLVQEFPEPESLYDLKKTIDDIFKELKSF